MVIVTHTDGEKLVEADLAGFTPNLNEVLYLPDLKRDHDRFLIVRISHEINSKGLITRCLVQDV
jgi:hypothetical protein